MVILLGREKPLATMGALAIFAGEQTGKEKASVLTFALFSQNFGTEGRAFCSFSAFNLASYSRAIGNSIRTIRLLRSIEPLSANGARNGQILARCCARARVKRAILKL
jgi:hypothetical protein